MKYGCRAHDYGCFTAQELAKVLANNGYNADLLDVVPFGATQLVDVGFGSEVLACANTVIHSSSRAKK